MSRAAIALGALLLAACAGQPPAGAPADPAQALNALLAEHWEWNLRENPEFATLLGDLRYNDRWSDNSLAGTQRQRADMAAFLARFRALDVSALPEQDRLNRDLLVRQLEDGIRSIDLKLHEMPVEQIGGAHLQLAQLIPLFPFETTKHYEDYLARLNATPVLFTDLVAVLRQGQLDGLMPPRYLLEKTVKQCEDIAAPAAADSPFGQPLKKFPGSVPAADRERLSAAILEAIDTKVRPGYRDLARFIATEYAPSGRTDFGVWALPGGEEIYRFSIAQRTTTQKSADEIHQLGLAEVARIEAEQLKIARKLGFRSLKAFRKHLDRDPKNRPKSRQHLIDLYRQYIDQMEPRLPELFGLLPPSRMEVVPVEEFREKDAAGASYARGTPDGKRPGRIYVNTGDYQNRTLTSVETTAYHEGLPGHHMQLAIAQTLPGLPPFRLFGGYTAYIEGWALYSERLGAELGFFKDPVQYFGHLDDELLRANRLVLDTGVHHKRWTRDQMVQWFRTHSSQSEPEIQSETDRYIVWPGQALAYKLGQLKILELREKARAALGAKFDVRAFHDHILSGGALPLDVLEKRFEGWLAAQPR